MNSTHWMSFVSFSDMEGMELSSLVMTKKYVLLTMYRNFVEVNVHLSKESFVYSLSMPAEVKKTVCGLPVVYEPPPISQEGTLQVHQPSQNEDPANNAGDHCFKNIEGSLFTQLFENVMTVQN